jgi:hypothetical protein
MAGQTAADGTLDLAKGALAWRPMWPGTHNGGRETQAEAEDEEVDVTEHQDEAGWSVADWHGKMLVDRNGEKIGKLVDVYVDVETGEPQFAPSRKALSAVTSPSYHWAESRSAPTTYKSQ